MTKNEEETKVLSWIWTRATNTTQRNFNQSDFFMNSVKQSAHYRQNLKLFSLPITLPEVCVV